MGNQRRGGSSACLRVIEFPGDRTLSAKKARTRARKPRPPVYSPEKEEYDRGQLNLSLNTRQMPRLMEALEEWMTQFEVEPHKTDVVRWLISECVAENRTPPWCERK